MITATLHEGKIFVSLDGPPDRARAWDPSFCARMATRWEAYGDWWAKDAKILRKALKTYHRENAA